MKEVIELFIDKDLDMNGVDMLSIVAQPAIEQTGIYLSNKKTNYTLAKMNERGLLVAPILIPDKEIYRHDEKTGREYYITFSKSTVSQIAHLFMASQSTSNISEEHKKDVDGVFLVESWTKESLIDKSVQYGFDVNNGTWMGYFDSNGNEEMKEKLRNNELGISIEGYFAEMMDQKLNKKKDFKTEVYEALHKLINNK